MAELAFDVVEQILVRMDVEDVIRCMSVCKSWLSLISTPRFVKAHLNHNIKSDRDNQQLGHRRICHSNDMFDISDDIILIVGSCNGLVCISPRDVEIVVTNPLTREQKKLPTPPYQPHMCVLEMISQEVCYGFGYDPCADDYKVIAGFRKRRDDRKWTTFYAFTLKSNTWKVIKDVRYRNILQCKSGVLCGGALHRFMKDANKKKVIISFDLSTEEFKEIPQPDAHELECDINYFELGVLEDCLCICLRWFSMYPMKKWVMKNNKWELYTDHCQTKYDVVHFMPLKLDSQKMCSLDGCIRVPSGRAYIDESIYVKSLVSPHLHVNDNNNDNYEGPLRNAKV
ncbi:F-box protein CPR1-like [Bidens hawaiensis]|uniref:F-box protein CPR1-like n=1 Tax=Bidens hawaiensis TaxID=980011 RepID=UPI00404A40E5